MKKYAFLLLLPLTVVAFVRWAHPTASDTYISFKGSRQGQFKAATKGKYGKETDGWFRIQSFDLQGEVPVDAAQGGSGGGKIKHKPIIVTKETDAATPLLLNAHDYNEQLQSVIIELVGRPTSGQGEVVIERITLTNAQIVTYKTDRGLENISLTYDQITKTK